MLCKDTMHRKDQGPAARLARSRRGSAIILAVGALVLLSVISLVYWGIGRADVRTARATTRSSSVDQTVNQFADYLSGVIGRDKTTWFVEKARTSSDPPVVYREAWDYPWVDPSRVSVVSDDLAAADIDRARFAPWGGMPDSWDPVRTGLNILAFDASDPWLAPHRPVFFGMNRGFEMFGRDWMLESRDWESISNFAPDGRFVNLYNLRNNFDALPAPLRFANMRALIWGPGDQPESMSPYLSLPDENGVATVDLVTGPRGTPNKPADWTMFQQYAFRPTVDVKYKFDDGRQAFYQWVDTDGDGFFDARWFELVDATIPGEVFSLLPRDDTFRWFVAARAIDLSGLVNVNTAVDLRGGETPTSAVGDDDYRVGSTPADIDLRRMLALQDTSRLYEEDGYAGLVNRPGPADYTEYKAN
ncbi:MAG: hypothetical protein IIB55_03530, partial [Planctomycetes bacterium]|nr:hypothetical protein [Planctomycetota bacterium]